MHGVSLNQSFAFTRNAVKLCSENPKLLLEQFFLRVFNIIY